MLWQKAIAGTASAQLFSASISTNQQEMNLATYATSQGWDGSSPAEITIDAGVYVWSDDTAVPAMTTGNFPNGLTLIVNGYIIGRGGDGGYTPSDGTSGGPALSLGCDVNIFGDSSGYIAGGGGGGGRGKEGLGGGGGAGGGDAIPSSVYGGGSGGLPGQAGEDGDGDSTGGGGGGSGGGGGAE